MATWKAENSMLTKLGVEILNKIKSGVGNITVTKVLAGSGRVSGSQLFTQTALSGSTKPMTISQKDVRETGSEISIYISNADYTESFNLNQIGVFVTHPDYEGEILYHISQCESVGFDVIPALDETPVTFGYNLFLEHGNSSSINLTIDPQGMVSYEQFNAFKTNTVSGNLVCIDGDGNLKDAGKSIEQIFNKNLLHNWDLRNPVDLRGNYVVPPMTPYYSDATLSTKVGETSDYYTVHYADSVSGRIYVGDGGTYYVPKSSFVRGYINTATCISRWSINPGVTSDAKSVLLPQDNSVKAILPTGYGSFRQEIATSNPSLFAGKPFTASVKVESLSEGANCKLYINDEINQTGVGLKVGMNTVTRVVDPSVKGLHFVIQNDGADSCEVEISIAKFELGYVSSLAMDPPADYAEQMALCSQYSPAYNSYLGVTPYSLVYGKADINRPQDVASTILEKFRSMLPDSSANFVLNINAGGVGGILEGGTWFVTIDKTSDSFGAVLAKKYAGGTTSQGIVIKTCSIYNGQLMNWGVINSNVVAPATLE